MAKPDTIIINGSAYSWRQICEARRQQLAAWKAGRAQQPALFELQDDRRPESQRRASGRYAEPTLFDAPARPP